ncbi:MAG: tripartite tricarboxylate transporter substrate binding protein [Betaproteobacteria bacterium]|nr:tripartite tricarboxylate transporter substrate binding protein [Betaproteobacteria bacterium]
MPNIQASIIHALRVVACALAIMIFAGPAAAQNYPVKPVRMVVPFPPGGNTDIIARVFAPKMAENLGQQIVVENRGGAGSVIGTDVVAKAAPDGYMILMVSAAHTINPAMIKKLPYDSVKDFTPIALIADVPTAFVVHPALPAKTVKEFIALARARPGQINYSTSGSGTVGHLAAELLSSMTGIKMVHVPYKGSGPSMVDLVAGHVQMQLSSMPAAIQYVRTGRLRLIAQTGKTRSAAAPDTPTMEEAGVPGFVVSSGFGMFAPANTPRAIVERIHAALVKALNDATVKDNLGKQGAEVVASTPDEYDQFNRAEIAKWIKVVAQAGITPE